MKILGNYFLIALSGEQARQQADNHFVLEFLKDHGIYEMETDLYWAKIPGYIPDWDRERNWHPTGGQTLLDRCATVMFCVDGSVLALLKGDSIAPMPLHQKAPLLVSIKNDILHVV